MRFVKHLAIILLACTWMATTIHAGELGGEKICVCDDGAEWPPYHFFKRENGKKTKEIVGYGVDALNEILNPKKIAYSIKLIPWKRCLRELERGDRYQMALGTRQK